MPEEIQFGWRKDPRDERDYLHATAPRAVLPVRINLAGFLPAVRNQGKVGSCTGHGIGANVTGVHRQQGADPEWESPTWIYNLGRKKAGWLNYDSGAYPRDCLDMLVEHGLAKEHQWPYDPEKLDTADPLGKNLPARKYADFAYYRCVDGLDGVLSALAAGHLVSVGAPWFAMWMSPGKDGALSPVTEADPIVGGHETCLYGYDIEKALLYGRNSWGGDWGNKGSYAMPFSIIDVFKKVKIPGTDQSWGYDAHYVTFTAPPAPQPEPEPPAPQPSPCRIGNGIASAMNAIFLQKARGRRGRFAYMNFPEVRQKNGLSRAI